MRNQSGTPLNGFFAKTGRETIKSAVLPENCINEHFFTVTFIVCRLDSYADWLVFDLNDFRLESILTA
jgi:hypothetical protein